MAEPRANRTDLGFAALPYRSSTDQFAARCLAIGIGRVCGKLVDHLAFAPWFAHVRGTASGQLRRSGPARDLIDRLQLIEAMLPLHVASVAIGTAPTAAELEFLCELGRFLRQYRVFVVITSALAYPEFRGRIHRACDCFIQGDGSPLHHYYPIRTVAEPASGRLFCYDLYDACSLWAGRVGEYGVCRPAADALHVEISSRVTTLKQVDALASRYADRLNHPANFQLLNVVSGLGLTEANAVSFSNSVIIGQERPRRSS